MRATQIELPLKTEWPQRTWHPKLTVIKTHLAPNFECHSNSNVTQNRTYLGVVMVIIVDSLAL